MLKPSKNLINEKMRRGNSSSDEHGKIDRYESAKLLQGEIGTSECGIKDVLRLLRDRPNQLLYAPRGTFLTPREKRGARSVNEDSCVEMPREREEDEPYTWCSFSLCRGKGKGKRVRVRTVGNCAGRARVVSRRALMILTTPLHSPLPTLHPIRFRSLHPRSPSFICLARRVLAGSWSQLKRVDMLPAVVRGEAAERRRTREEFTRRGGDEKGRREEKERDRAKWRGKRERRIVIRIPPGSGGSVMADERLDGSRDKLKRDPSPSGRYLPRWNWSFQERNLECFLRSPAVCLPTPHVSVSGIDCVPGVHRSSWSLSFSLWSIPSLPFSLCGLVEVDQSRCVSERSLLLHLCECSSPTYVLNMMAMNMMTGKWYIYAGYGQKPHKYLFLP